MTNNFISFPQKVRRTVFSNWKFYKQKQNFEQKIFRQNFGKKTKAKQERSLKNK